MRDIIHLLIHLHTIRVSRIKIFFPPFDNLTIKRSPAPNHLPQFPRMILTLDPPSPQKMTSHYTFNRFRNLRQPQSFHLPSVPPPRSQTTYNEHPRLSKIDSFNSPLRQKLDTAQSKITLSLSRPGGGIYRDRESRYNYGRFCLVIKCTGRGIYAHARDPRQPLRVAVEAASRVLRWAGVARG